MIYDVSASEPLILVDVSQPINDLKEFLHITEQAMVTNSKFVPIYGNIDDADNYFAVMIHGQGWSVIPREKKLKGLIAATKRIENLNFSGEHGPDQLFFPRVGEDKVPIPVEQATYELAYSLLQGIDPEKERANLVKNKQEFGQVRIGFDRSVPPPHILAGIPNSLAWDYLSPYISPRTSVSLERVS